MAVAAPLPPPPSSQQQRPSTAAPKSSEDGASAELFVKLQHGDTLDKLLARAGVAADDAATANTLVAGALPSGIAAGTEVAVLLGEAKGAERH
ncbi:MAG: hypothetical protein H0U34_06880, partial [Sphingomonas sp.]|nr:hypothetical protein [Sphingomonas sp.]